MVKSTPAPLVRPGLAPVPLSLVQHISRKIDEWIETFLRNLFAPSDATALTHGWTVDDSNRWSRTYRDPRMDHLRVMRVNGCSHLPVCRSAAECPEARQSAGTQAPVGQWSS